MFKKAITVDEVKELYKQSYCMIIPLYVGPVLTEEGDFESLVDSLSEKSLDELQKIFEDVMLKHFLRYQKLDNDESSSSKTKV